MGNDCFGAGAHQNAQGSPELRGQATKLALDHRGGEHPKIKSAVGLGYCNAKQTKILEASMNRTGNLACGLKFRLVSQQSLHERTDGTLNLLQVRRQIEVHAAPRNVLV